MAYIFQYDKHLLRKPNFPLYKLEYTNKKDYILSVMSIRNLLIGKQCFCFLLKLILCSLLLSLFDNNFMLLFHKNISYFYFKLCDMTIKKSHDNDLIFVLICIFGAIVK